MDDVISLQGTVCPLPLSIRDHIVMGHGSGGKMTHDLVNQIFVSHFNNPVLNSGDDAASVSIARSRLAISTDSHVVWPLFFPGGDIGRLAICGTVNDVAMMGAMPLYLTAGFILEEGLDLNILKKVVDSMESAAAEAGIKIIAGDTKVVQKGKADGLYINTTGIGSLPADTNINGSGAKPGDLVILSGPIGDHGIAVLQARGELGFTSNIKSDVAPLNHLVRAMLSVNTLQSPVHVLRDPTRGGLATTLNEIAGQSNVTILLQEKKIPVRPAVMAACEMLGFDPYYIANEGKLIAIVARESAEELLQKMHVTTYGEEAVVIGEVLENTGRGQSGRVQVRTAIGSTRVLDVLAGEMLPRIC